MRLDSVLNVLMMTGAMTLASPAIAAGVPNDSFSTLAIDDSVRHVGNAVSGQTGSANSISELRSPEVVDPEASASEASGAAEQPIESAHDIRIPEVRDPEIETNNPDIQGPDIEMNIPEMQTPDVPEVPNTPEVDVPDS